jgi:2-polyprenyl-6-methoxyphenol hydroxylase-like FAD-dependent oxidoreductase
MSSIRNKKIAIVGAGPGGLTLARLLQMQGADVRVYERDRSRDARIQGSALDLHEHSGLAALEAAGLTDQFWANYRPDLNQLLLTDPEGNILHVHERRISGEGQRPEIERGPLRDILLDSLKPDTVHWDRKLESAEFLGDQVMLLFAGGERVVADLAIGADGANSRLRPLVTPISPQYVGVSLVEGSVPAAAEAVPQLWSLLEGSALIALGSERTLGMGTKPDGSILFYAGLKSSDTQARQPLEEAGSAAQRVAWFRANFAGWSALWEPLFVKAATLVWRPLLTCPADQHWAAEPNVTLIGDAAHVMPPYAGEGVNMAMLDALMLSQRLTGASDLIQAIAAYEEEMFTRMRHMTDDTMRNTEMFYASDAADQVVGLFRSFAGNSLIEISNANTAEYEIYAANN